jgi:hypothetical protein
MDVALTWYREQGIEPPANAFLRRLIRSTLRMHEAEFCAHLAAQLPPALCQALEALLAGLVPTSFTPVRTEADLIPWHESFETPPVPSSPCASRPRSPVASGSAGQRSLHLDGHLFDRAGERKRQCVREVHRRAHIHADV